MQQKDVEQRLLQRQVQILLQENKTYLQGLEEEKKRSHLEVTQHNYVQTQIQGHQNSVTFVVMQCLFLQTEHYLEQQMSVSRLRQNLLAVRSSLLEAGASGTAEDTSQSVCLTRHGCKYENTGRVGVSQSYQ